MIPRMIQMPGGFETSGETLLELERLVERGYAPPIYELDLSEMSYLERLVLAKEALRRASVLTTGRSPKKYDLHEIIETEKRMRQ